MNAALSVILSIVTVAAGGTAALAGDLISPHSIPADDCVAGVCLGGGHGNQTEPEPGPGRNQTAGNGTHEPEPEPAPQNETGHHHHYHNETYHHHHAHNGTAGNRTQEPAGPEDVHFCTTGLSVLGGYDFEWEVHGGFEAFHLDWHFQSLALGLVLEPDVHVVVLDGAGDVVLEAHGRDALSFHLETDDLRGYAPGTWSFSLNTGEVAAEQGLVGSVEY